MFIIDPMQLPNLKLTGSGIPRQTQPLTVGNVKKVLEVAGLQLRFNMMTNSFELTGAGYSSSDVDQRAVFTRIEDTLLMLDIGGLTRLPAVLNSIAQSCGSYHPMEDWILSAPWDETDRLGPLAESVPTDSPVWPEYLRKWLIQAVEGVRGWHKQRERSIPHVLVFAGGQGAGKGRWLRELAPGFVLADAELHLSAYGAKDQQIQVLNMPIVELGEIDSTFKRSEVSALKSFLSRQVDEIRMPYARAALRRPRVTTFAGSVNTLQFINDVTGARRFWPVQLRDNEEINWDHGIDMQQVFAQANVLWEEGEDWNLEDWTVAEREEELEEFVQRAPVVELAAAHWEKYRGDHEHYGILNRTEIARLIGASTHPAELAALNEWLTRVLGPPRKLKSHQRSWAFPIGKAKFHVSGDYQCISEKEAKEYVLAQNVQKRRQRGKNA